MSLFNKPLSTQWAAVRIIFSLIIDPPQNLCLQLSIFNLTIHGNSCGPAFSPPNIASTSKILMFWITRKQITILSNMIFWWPWERSNWWLICRWISNIWYVTGAPDFQQSWWGQVYGVVGIMCPPDWNRVT